MKARLLTLSREKEGRSSARACFQAAPSLLKIELPRSGWKTARRFWRDRGSEWVVEAGGGGTYGACFEVLGLEG